MKLSKTHIILLFALIMTLFLCAGSAFAYEVDDMQIMDKNVQLSSSDDGGDNGVQSNIFDTNLKSDVESSNLKLVYKCKIRSPIPINPWRLCR